jgi:hypothetical protein
MSDEIIERREQIIDTVNSLVDHPIRELFGVEIVNGLGILCSIPQYSKCHFLCGLANLLQSTHTESPVAVQEDALTIQTSNY